MEEQGAVKVPQELKQMESFAGKLYTKSIARLFGFVMILSYCGMIIVSKQTKHKAADLGFIRGVSYLLFGLFYRKLSGEPFYVREGRTMELFMARGIVGALTFAIEINANKLLSSAIFAVICRMKVFFMLILSSLFSAEYVDFRMLLLTITAFFGICLVMDPSIFGFPTTSDPNSIRIIGLKRELVGILYCILYMILSSIARTVMYYATMPMTSTQAFFFIGLFNILNNSLIIFFEPIQWRLDELHTYFLVSFLSIGFLYGFCIFLEYETNMNVFIMIQTSIVFFTFVIDVVFFGHTFNYYNVTGALMVMGSAGLVLLIH